MVDNFHELMGRIWGIAVIDVVGTILIAYAVSKYKDICFFKTLVMFLIFGEVVHIFLNIETPITKIVTGTFGN